MPTYQIDVRVDEKAEAGVYKTVEIEAEDEEKAKRKAGRGDAGRTVEHEHNATDIRGPETHRTVTGRPHEV